MGDDGEGYRPQGRVCSGMQSVTYHDVRSIDGYCDNMVSLLDKEWMRSEK